MTMILQCEKKKIKCLSLFIMQEHCDTTANHTVAVDWNKGQVHLLPRSLTLRVFCLHANIMFGVNDSRIDLCPHWGGRLCWKSQISLGMPLLLRSIDFYESQVTTWRSGRRRSRQLYTGIKYRLKHFVFLMEHFHLPAPSVYSSSSSSSSPPP